ncbi:PGAP1-like protein-domain-containing protein [Halteromyces radiatus]|uniref:PGAP1-like protein-domain-containing protein n=1 Tax=Halteromyces radiatus TaxID=101107 RepID=UPI002220E9F7|nr:PGAP1-like protein-domain-containing protein [Halteromyces radiatus]KAI8089198.1 PGAP1-like protein-domain-containing protein [Halteromyces radiatus]
MTPRTILLALIVISLLGFYVILDSFIYHQRDPPGCQMSYSRPSFIPLQVPHARLTDKYSLYLYREGGIDSNQLLGVPTLFIPGHAGSYKQARSIAAESAYYLKSLPQSDQKHGLDMFTVDLNEEFSALSGGLIHDQAEYLNDAIQQILTYYRPKEYQGQTVPESVIIVGHSMGGIVARVMQHLPNYIKGSINTIFTLATPHSMPPINLDPILDDIYRTFLTKPLNNTALISVAGGTQDSTVNSDATILDTSSYGSLTVFTTAVPKAWTGCDHMAILWCNQLVTKVAASLVDIIDVQSASQTVPMEQRMEIFRKWLSPTNVVTVSSAPTYLLPSTASTSYFDQSKWNLLKLKEERQYRFTLDQTEGRFGLLSNIQDPLHLHLGLCKRVMDHFICSRIESGFQLLPSRKATNQAFDSNAYLRLLVLDHALWKDFDLLVMDYMDDHITTTETTTDGNDLFVATGMYAETTWKKDDRSKDISLFDLTIGGGIQWTLHHDTLASVYHFPVIDSSLLSFKLHVTKSQQVSNTSMTTSFYHKPLIQQYFYGEYKFHIIDNETPAALHFHRSPLFNNNETASNGLVLTVWTIDGQDLQLRLILDWYGTIGKCVLRLGPVLPMYLFVVALSYLTYILSWCSSSSSSSDDTGRHRSYDVETGLMNWMTNRSRYSLRNLCAFVMIIECLQQAWKSGGSNLDASWVLGGSYSLPLFLWWLPLALVLLATGLFLSLSVVLSLVIFILQKIVPSKAQPSTFSSSVVISFSLWVVLFSCLGWLPISVVMVIAYIRWLFLCINTYASARTHNQYEDWLRYRYRFSLLMLLTTWLPYYLPGTIIYIRDMMVGWHFAATSTTLLNDLTTIFSLVILALLEYCEWVWRTRASIWLIHLSLDVILFYILFGVQHPFAIQHTIRSFTDSILLQ